MNNMLGSTKINIKQALVNKKINCRLTYTVGSYGLDEGGGIKILFRLPCDAPQPKIKVSSSNKKVKIVDKIDWNKAHRRPWKRGIILDIKRSFLKPGDKIYVDFIDWQMQSFAENIFQFKIAVDAFGTTEYRYLTNSPQIKVISNQKINIKKTNMPGHYWADLHWQSNETVGTNTAEEGIKFARDKAKIDITCHQGNDFQITDEFWKKLNQLTEKYNQENKFIIFPGYEWSGNTPVGGDRNVIYLEEGNDIYRSSDSAPTANDLFQKLKNKKALVLAHVGGRYANLDMHDETTERAIEIHSQWGTFEWFFRDALKRGYKVGVVANSDAHTGQPGASFPSGHFCSYGGLTCVLAKRLTRKDIFEAIYNQQTYATTGAKIFLETNYQNNKYRVQAKGTAPIDRIELYDKTKKIYSYYPELKTNKVYIKIIWTGARDKGRSRALFWENKITAPGIKNVEQINFYQQSSINKKNNSLLIEGITAGGVQGVILELTKKAGNLHLKINNKKFKLDIKNISPKETVYKLPGLDSQLEVYQVGDNFKPGLIDFNKQVNKQDLIYTKVIQRDGHLAWSSPIYFK